MRFAYFHPTIAAYELNYQIPPHIRSIKSNSRTVQMTPRLKILLIIIASMCFGALIGYTSFKNNYLPKAHEAIEILTSTMIYMKEKNDLKELHFKVMQFRMIENGDIKGFKRATCVMMDNHLKNAKTLREKSFTTNTNGPIPQYIFDAKQFVEQQKAIDNCSLENNKKQQK